MNPNKFPTEFDAPLLLKGPSGMIEALSTYPQEKNSNTVGLICHPHPLHGGSMNNKVVHTVSRAFHHCGYATLRFNYRGVGASEGEYGNYSGEIDDALSIIKWIHHVLPNYKVVLSGFSFGAYVATSVSKHIKSKALITVAPAVNHKDFRTLLPINCPWLIIHGDKDELVPIQAIKEFHTLIQEPHEFKILHNSDHFFHHNLIQLRTQIEEYLNTLN